MFQVIVNFTQEIVGQFNTFGEAASLAQKYAYHDWRHLSCTVKQDGKKVWETPFDPRSFSC